MARYIFIFEEKQRLAFLAKFNTDCHMWMFTRHAGLNYTLIYSTLANGVLQISIADQYYRSLVDNKTITNVPKYENVVHLCRTPTGKKTNDTMCDTYLLD